MGVRAEVGEMEWGKTLERDEHILWERVLAVTRYMTVGVHLTIARLRYSVKNFRIINCSSDKALSSCRAIISVVISESDLRESEYEPLLIQHDSY